MKKFVCAFLLTAVLTAMYSFTAWAATGEIDTSHAKDGYVTIALADYKNETIKVQVLKGDQKYLYTLINEETNIPLQMGAGDYTVQLLVGVGGGMFKPVTAADVSVTSVDEAKMYTISNPFMEYSVSTEAIPAYKEMTEGETSEDDKISVVYEDVVNAYAYDNALAASVLTGNVSGYIPVIDDVYAAKKGICFDYSAVFGGALRSQGIPTRMVMGYPPEQPGTYHAWNEVLINGKWVSIDTTFDSAAAAADQPYTMIRDRSKAVVLKIY